tara:strand:+ start:8 stop:388 length:381 start_codon:yes stop_codon:yes gene_type:complete
LSIRAKKSARAFRTIGEAASELDVPQHVLRFWEVKFSQISPVKRRGGRRYYRPKDIDLLLKIRKLLYDDGYTIKGVQKLFEKRVKNSLKLPKSEGSQTQKVSNNNSIDASVFKEIITELEELRKLL